MECYPGENLREVAMREGIELYGLKGQLGNCGGCGQCITCFVSVVDEAAEMLSRLEPPLKTTSSGAVQTSGVWLVRPLWNGPSLC